MMMTLFDCSISEALERIELGWKWTDTKKNNGIYRVCTGFGLQIYALCIKRILSSRGIRGVLQAWSASGLTPMFNSLLKTPSP